MAEDLSAQKPVPFAYRAEVGGTPNELTEFILPAWVGVARVTVPQDTTSNASEVDAKVALVGVDGSAIGSHWVDVMKGSTLPFFRPRREASDVHSKKQNSGTWSIYITATAAVTVCIDAVEDY